MVFKVSQLKTNGKEPRWSHLEIGTMKILRIISMLAQKNVFPVIECSQAERHELLLGITHLASASNFMVAKSRIH